MPELPSFYFTLFKKFQVVNHVPASMFHGNTGAPSGGFNLADPNAANGVFGSASIGSLLALGDSTPANNPLWAVLNAGITLAGGTLFPIPGGPQAGQMWPAMPLFGTPGWSEFQLNAPAPKLVNTLANWIMAGKIKDVPNPALATMPPVINAGLDANTITPFVCSMPGDTGVRPGVPANFWATSLIFLVDPNTGNTVNPATLTGSSEYWLVAVLGNRGANDGGRYAKGADPTMALALQAAGTVMVWNTFDSPGVRLPALSNLDVNSIADIYEQYFLPAGHYDVVGFRLNVQTVYDGIIAALNYAVANNGLNLGGQSPDQWVKMQPAHLCAKVAVRIQGGAFPNVDITPDMDARIAQKNLAPFDIGITTVSGNPNIMWNNFMVGQPLALMIRPGENRNILILETDVPAENFHFYLAIPTATFERFFTPKAGAKITGWKLVSREQLCRSKLGDEAKPFPDAVVLRLQGKNNAIELPALPQALHLALSLGVEYTTKGLKHGKLGEITFVQRTVLPVLKPGTRCFEMEPRTVGGFTLQVRATDDNLVVKQFMQRHGKSKSRKR